MVKISVAKLAKIHNPFRDAIWNNNPVTIEQVNRAIEERRFVEIPYNLDRQPENYDHVGRIAYFVIYGWKNPIEIDVGIPLLGHHKKHLIEDGHHRLAAAIYRKDQFITAIIDGQISYANEILGTKLKE